MIICPESGNTLCWNSGVLFQAGAQRVVCTCLHHIYKGCPTSTCKGLRSGFTCSSSGFKRIQRREKAKRGGADARRHSWSNVLLDVRQSPARQETQHTPIHWQKKKSLSNCKAAQERFNGCINSVSEKWVLFESKTGQMTHDYMPQYWVGSSL